MRQQVCPGDGFQAYGSGNMHGTILKGNTIISSFHHPNLALYDGTMQGIGLFSTYVDYVIKNNIVMSDHRIGIWLLGGKNCTVVNSSTVVNAGDPIYAPLLDAEQVARNGRIDLGAYQYISGLTADTQTTSVPQGLTGVIVPGLGVDLSWTASTDNRKVNGYEIYRNGASIGRVRTGTHFLDPILNLTGMTYTVKAFDFLINFSAASLSIAPN